mgnify:CR=1 FL=1
MKVKWKVSEAPSGPFRSLYDRSWPSAEVNGKPAFSISCKDSYIPALVKKGEYEELSLNVAVYDNEGKFVWRKFVKRFSTLVELKEFAQRYVNDHKEEYSRISSFA